MPTPEEMPGKLETKIEATEKEPIKKMRFMYGNVREWFQKNKKDVDKMIDYAYEQSQKNREDEDARRNRKALVSMMIYDPGYKTKNVRPEDMKGISNEILYGTLEIFYGVTVDVGKNQYKMSELCKKIEVLSKDI